MYDKPELLARSLQLASLGLGTIGSTPLCGWLLVNEQKQIVSEGWLPKSPILSNSSFAGNFPDQTSTHLTLVLSRLSDITPELMIKLQQYKIGQIQVATSISDDLKNTLRKAHIEVEDALLHEEEAFLNRRFFTFHSEHRPYIILKWAETADGFVARKNFDSKWISNSLSRRLVHKWRAEEDAIMVGTNTAHYDNPRLNVRDWSGSDPLRIVIDKNLRLDSELLLFDGSQPTLCYNLKTSRKSGKNEWVRLQEKNSASFFKAMLHDLYERNVQSLIVEGGSQLLHFLIEHQLWDEARVFTAEVFFKEGIAAPKIADAMLLSDTKIDSDRLRIYQKLNRK